jgi:hypothetical protein
MRIRLLEIWGCAVALGVTLAGAAQADEAIGQVKTAKGTVQVVHQGQILPLKVGDHVFQSDTVMTEKSASVGITFTDNSMMSLGSNSKLALSQYRFDATTHVGVFDSVLSQGTLAAKSGQIVKQRPEAMHISTPTALLGVRGTEFVVRVEGKS